MPDCFSEHEELLVYYYFNVTQSTVFVSFLTLFLFTLFRFPAFNSCSSQDWVSVSSRETTRTAPLPRSPAYTRTPFLY